MSSLQRMGYESARPTHVCAASGRAFEAGERYVATLGESPESDDFLRFDFCVEAWEGGARPPPPVRPVAVWRARAAGREDRRSMLLDDEEILGLLEGLDPLAEGRAAVFRYLLALLLLRRRVLRVKDQRVGEGGRPVLVLVRRGGPKGLEPEPIEVTDPGMDEQAVAAGIEELGVVLAGGGEGAARGDG
ncbi:MAG: hypothetical protein IPJ41_14515 [Phycisphaerales bacterium]|nr:hypothetical protein [Phycisphaerales bacterium]